MRRQGSINYVIILPQILLFIIWYLVPILLAIIQSFFNLEMGSGKLVFAGAANYVRLIKDYRFFGSVSVTIVYSLNVPITMCLAFLMSLNLSKFGKAKRLFELIYFLPAVCSWAAISMVWRRVLDPNLGLANYILNKLGMEQQLWLVDSNMAMICLIVVAVWLNIGYQVLVFDVAQEMIPHELYEAARIDGARSYQSLIFITLPHLRPAFFFVFMTSLYASFQVFTQVYMMTMGGPARATEVIMLDIYRTAWSSLEFGYAVTKSTVYFFFMVIVTALLFTLFRKKSYVQ